MSISDQLDQLELAIAYCRRRGKATMDHSACSPAAVACLVAVCRAAHAFVTSDDEDRAEEFDALAAALAKITP